VGKVDPSLPQDAAAKKARAKARAAERYIKKNAKKPVAVKPITVGRNPVLKVRDDIKVIKRRGGTVRFAKALKKVSLENKKAAAKRALKPKVEGEEKKKAVKPSKKFRICRMREKYHTQLPMRYAAAKGSMKHVNNPTKLRKSLIPGTVCIILAGRHVGKKCIFLKQIKRSGLLLVTGPHKVNGVPLRRVDQKHVIATSVRVPLPETFKLPAYVDDFLFKKSRGTKKNSTTKPKDAALKGKAATKKPTPDKVRDAQRAIDKVMIKSLKKHVESTMVFKYLKRNFHLIGDRYAHNLKF